MGSVTFRFFEELNDFLPREKRKAWFEHQFSGRVSVKDMIESIGVPHTEIDLILINSKPVDFSAIVKDGDRISVYPVFEAIDISSITRLRPEPLRENRFVLDVHLGRLAFLLRLAGF
ncbi:twitching motility protein PilT, partial [bacterium]|nr:twitching motility protein PilT [candidate division CSSED10-310 bacterium]